MSEDSTPRASHQSSFRTSKTFTATSSLFFVPENVTRIRVTVIAPGNNGGSGGSVGPGPAFAPGGSGGRGAQGGYGKGIFAVTPGQSFLISVGAAAGVPAENASFGNLLSATGGTMGGTGGPGSVDCYGYSVTGGAGTPGTVGTATGTGILKIPAFATLGPWQAGGSGGFRSCYATVPATGGNPGIDGMVIVEW